MTLPCVKHLIHLGKRFRSNLTIKKISFNSCTISTPRPFPLRVPRVDTLRLTNGLRAVKHSSKKKTTLESENFDKFPCHMIISS